MHPSCFGALAQVLTDVLRVVLALANFVVKIGVLCPKYRQPAQALSAAGTEELRRLLLMPSQYSACHGYKFLCIGVCHSINMHQASVRKDSDYRRMNF